MFQRSATIGVAAAAMLAPVAGGGAAPAAMPRQDSQFSRIVVRCVLEGDAAGHHGASLCARIADAARVRTPREVIVQDAGARLMPGDLLVKFEGAIDRAAGAARLTGSLRTARLRRGEDADPAPIPLALALGADGVSATLDRAVAMALDQAQPGARRADRFIDRIAINRE